MLFEELGLYIDLNDTQLLSVDNEYIYYYSDSNKSIYKALYKTLHEYSPSVKPYAILDVPSSTIEAITSVKNDGNIDFVATNNQLKVYETNPSFEVYTDHDFNVSTPQIVTKIEPRVLQSNAMNFTGALNSLLINRETNTLYISNDNSNVLKILTYENNTTFTNTELVNLNASISGIYIRDSKLYVTYDNLGLEIYDLPITQLSEPIVFIENVGADISSPFTFDGTTFNYLSKEEPKVQFLADSFIDGTSTGSYSVVNEDSLDTSAGFEGCFIATAAYGSYFEEHVKTLRDFRDNYLLTNELGRMFVSFYYNNSPAIADKIASSDVSKTMVRIVLTPVVYIIKYPLTIFFSLLVILFGYFIRRRYLAHNKVAIS